MTTDRAADRGPATTDESTLVAALRQREDWSYEQLVHQHAGRMTAVALRVLGNLDYPCRAVQTLLPRIDGRLFPCIFAPNGGPVMVIFEGDGETFTVLDGSTGAIAEIDGRGMSGTAYIVSQAEKQTVIAEQRNKQLHQNQVDKQRENHRIAHFTRVRAADKDAVELKAPD